MEHFSIRRWKNIPAPLVSYSVHEGKHFLFQLWVDFFLSWFTTGPVVHLLLLKFSKIEVLQCLLSSLYRQPRKLFKLRCCKYKFSLDFEKSKAQLWHSWQTGLFQHQRFVVQIRPLTILIGTILHWKMQLISLCLDLAKIHNFGKSLRVIGKKLTVYLLSGKMLSLRWQISDIKGLIVIVANGQIL